MAVKKPTAAQEREFANFVEKRGALKFRRADLSSVLYKHTNPRSQSGADILADIFIQRLRAENKAVRVGQVHWQLVVPKERQLKSGRMVPELPATNELTLTTRCPQKWVSVDLETGHIWVGSADGWRKADSTITTELQDVLAQTVKA